MDYVKRPKSGKTRGTQNKLDLARHGGENMSLADLTNYIRNIGAAGGDTSQFDAQLARAKERENNKRTDDNKSSLINYIKDAPRDISQPTQGGNVPKKDSWIAGIGDKDIGLVSRIRESRGQSHGSQSTSARKRTPMDLKGSQEIADPRKEGRDPKTHRRRKSLFDKIKEDIAKKNYKK